MLFDQLKIRDIVFRNRIFLSPMCQYSATDDGQAQDWHMVHYGSMAVGGVSLVMLEATAVSPEGRISIRDLGLWNSTQAEKLMPIVRFAKSQGAKIGLQLAHAGRKAASDVAEEIVAPSAIKYSSDYSQPKAMSESDIEKVISDFKNSASLALQAGFEVIELHMAHGYLLHQCLSPISNQRKDRWGGGLQNRFSLPIAVTKAVREVWPLHLPLFVRISATDWVEGGWDLEQSILLVNELKKYNVDLIDCSSGGLSPMQKITVGPGYQVPFSHAIKQQAQVMTGAVGMITDAKQANQILLDKKADVVFLARELLRQPHWPLAAAEVLCVSTWWPKQYERAKGSI